jgi:hypothetical protein
MRTRILDLMARARNYVRATSETENVETPAVERGSRS